MKKTKQVEVYCSSLHKISAPVIQDNKVLIESPFSPAYAAKTIAKLMEQQYRAIYRPVFRAKEKEVAIYQHHESGEGWTGYDHLIVAGKNYSVFAIDLGTELDIVSALFVTNKGKSTKQTVEYMEVEKARKYGMVAPADVIYRALRESHSKASQEYEEITTPLINKTTKN